MAKSKWTVNRELAKRIEFTLRGETCWISVRPELSIGEDRAVKNAAFRGVTGTGDGQTEISIDWKKSSFARTMAYLLAWSLKDEADDKLPLTLEVVQELHDDVYEAIEAAINKHIEEQVAGKKAQGGTAPLPPTSM